MLSTCRRGSTPWLQVPVFWLPWGSKVCPQCCPATASLAPKGTVVGPSAQAAQVVQGTSAAETQLLISKNTTPALPEFSHCCIQQGPEAAPTRSCITASIWCSFLLRVFLYSSQHPATSQMFLCSSHPRSCLLQHLALRSPP